MAESKVEVLLRICEVDLGRAERSFEAGEYDSSAFHASMAVENAANALILKLGGDEPKNHRAISGLAEVIRRVKPQWLTEDSCMQLIDRGKGIQREVVYARYPIKVGGAWVTPMEYYTEEKSRRIIDDAKFVVNEIKKYLKKTS